MKTLHLQPIVPQYLKDFQCLGPECPETCCQGWQVDIDENTYKKYLKVENYSLAKKLKIAVKPADNPCRSRFATIQMGNDGKCPLLAPSGLCEVHSKLGSNYLSDTCQLYPRSYIYMNNQLRSFGTMSCPGIAKSALLEPNALLLTKMDIALLGKGEIPVTIHSDVKTNPDMVVEFSEPIYEVMCMVLRHPELTATEAMLVLTLMMQKISRHFAESDPMAARTQLVQTLTDFCNPAYCMDVKNAMDTVPPQTRAKIYLLKGVTLKHLHERKARPTFAEVLALAAQGLNFEAADLGDTEASYIDAEKNWFEPFDSRYSYILKNYLLNDLGKHNLPAGKSLKMEAEFMSLVVRFTLVKLYLIGVAGVRKEAFSEQDYVNVIYTFSRNLEHSSFFAETLEAMEQQGYAGLASAALLLR